MILQTQAELFDHFEVPAPTLPAQVHSDTSRAAAERARPLAASVRSRLLHHLEGRGSVGATDRELQAALNIDGSSERPARVALVAQGLVRDSGQRRPTASGRPAVVWIVTGSEEACR